MMTQIKQLYRMISLIAILALINCGGTGDIGGVAGIGGSGFISTGTITSFGSVFVNGVEFDTDASTFSIDDLDGSQQDLRIGMVVQISGSINPDGTTGIATHINYGENLSGVVSNLTVTATGKQFTLLQQVVMVSAKDTNFEDTTFADIANGNVLEASGYYDQSGALKATYIEFKSATSSDSTVVEIKGLISGLSGSLFQVQGVNVDASAANLENLPAGLQNNIFVKVEGVFTNGVISALDVKGQSSISEDNDVEMQGLVTRYVSNSDFDVNDQPVNAENAILSPAGLIIAVGLELEVNGRVSNGVLIANEVEVREGVAEVSATVAAGSIDLQNNRFSVELLPGQLVTIQVTTSTLLIDDVGDDDNLLLSELNVGDYVKVRGLENTQGVISATRIKRDNEVSGNKLQGIVTLSSASGFTVLGVTYPVDSNTVYNENVALSNAGFIALITLNQTLLSISDEDPADGIADDIEIDNNN